MREKSICGLYDVCFNLPSLTHLEMCNHLKTDNKRLSLVRHAGMTVHIDTSAENIVLPANSGYAFFLHCYSCNYFYTKMKYRKNLFVLTIFDYIYFLMKKIWGKYYILKL